MRYPILKKFTGTALLLFFTFLSLASELKSVDPAHLFVGKGNEVSFVFDNLPSGAKLKIYPGGS